MFSEFPTNTDAERILQGTPLKSLTLATDDFCIVNSSGNQFKDYLRNIQLSDWVIILGTRIADVEMSYVFAAFFFEKGIPDDPYFISPGKRGNSYDLFPLFTEQEHSNRKGNFDFFLDTFYHKLFAALDTLGHIIFTAYGLALNGDREKVSFKTAIRKLQSVDAELHRKLKAIKRSEVFEKADQTRNDATHNNPATSVSSGVRIEEKRMSLGVGKYRNCATSMGMMSDAMTMLIEVIGILRQHIPKQQ